MKQKPTILLVDDDQDDLLLLREAISEISSDYEMVERDNGRSALDYLRTNTNRLLPHLIVLDINMPVLSGKETLAILKADENFREIPVVLFSTSSSEADRNFAEKFGVAHHTKPLDMSRLMDVAHKLLSYCKPAGPQ